MANIVQKLIKSARIVALEGKNSTLTENESIRKFMSIFSCLTIEDLDFRPQELCYVPRIPKKYQSPVSFVDIYRDDHFSLQLFGLRDRFSCIPLHDHPAMHGFIKCIHGSVRIKSFTLLPTESVPEEVSDKVRARDIRNLVRAVFAGEETVSSSDNRLCRLTPTDGNVHEILSASDDLAVIADVIMPPYDTLTQCNFFEPIDTVFDHQLGEEVVWMLKTTDSPKEFHCQTIHYHGPAVC